MFNSQLLKYVSKNEIIYANLLIRSAQKKLHLHKKNIMLKIGVLGVGHLGRIHVKCIKLIEEEKAT